MAGRELPASGLRPRDGMRRIAELETALEVARGRRDVSARLALDLEKERDYLQARVDELEKAQRRHEGAVHAAYFAAWNECTQQMAQAAYAARNANPEAILNLMGEHE